MNLRARLREHAAADPASQLFARYGVVGNPYPSAGQPSGHPHMPTPADDEIEKRLAAFERDNTSQVLVIEGTQGVGKTNLLNYYQRELEDLYRGEKGAYIIRYYPDPEPSFDGVLRRIFQELGPEHLVLLGRAIGALGDDEREEVLEQVVRNHEVRCLLRALLSAPDGDRPKVAQIGLEWLLGTRLLNKHRDALGVNFRLDTVESKTQAFRDLVEVSIEVECLKGIFLLLDELEKQDLTLSKTTVLKYLLSIRALVDALPRNFFLMVAVTPDAKRRYFQMVPAFQGRLQNAAVLKTILTELEALEIARFYLNHAREKANTVAGKKPGKIAILTEAQVKAAFVQLRQDSATRGLEGVTHRDFLNVLHNQAESVFATALVNK